MSCRLLCGVYEVVVVGTAVVDGLHFVKGLHLVVAVVLGSLHCLRRAHGVRYGRNNWLYETTQEKQIKLQGKSGVVATKRCAVALRWVSTISRRRRLAEGGEQVQLLARVGRFVNVVIEDSASQALVEFFTIFLAVFGWRPSWRKRASPFRCGAFLLPLSSQRTAGGQVGRHVRGRRRVVVAPGGHGRSQG